MKTLKVLSLATAISVTLLSGMSARAGTLYDGFRGMNWVGPAAGSFSYGLDSSMDNNAARNVGQRIGYAVKNAGGNTVRMPIEINYNDGGHNWNIFAGAVAGVRQSGCNVILCYWPQQGTLPDWNGWWSMWDAANGSFGNDGGVIFEPINEPYGYSATDLCNLYASFLYRYSPGYHKCILAGTGYETGVQDIGNDSRLSNQLIGLHGYFWFWGQGGDWRADYNVVQNIVGPYAWRTVITEVGVATGSTSYFWQQWGGNLYTDVAFLGGTLAWARDNNVGTIAWSGANNQDGYRWWQSVDNLSEIKPDVCDMFRWAWLQTPWYNLNSTSLGAGMDYKICARHDGKVLDASGYGTYNGTQIQQWTYVGGSNQRWVLWNAGNGAWYIQGVQSGKFIDISGWGTSNGTKVQLWDGTGGTNQRYYLNQTDSGFFSINPSHATGSCLDVEGISTSDGAKVHLWQWLGGNNQQWSFHHE